MKSNFFKVIECWRRIIKVRDFAIPENRLQIYEYTAFRN
jgi:hypothetical protein